MDSSHRALAAAAYPRMAMRETQQVDPDLSTGTLHAWLESFHRPNAMPFPSAQTGNKLFGRQWWPPSSRVLDKPKMPEVHCCRLVFRWLRHDPGKKANAEIAEISRRIAEIKTAFLRVPPRDLSDLRVKSFSSCGRNAQLCRSPETGPDRPVPTTASPMWVVVFTQIREEPFYLSFFICVHLR